MYIAKYHCSIGTYKMTTILLIIIKLHEQLNNMYVVYRTDKQVQN